MIHQIGEIVTIRNKAQLQSAVEAMSTSQAKLIFDLYGKYTGMHQHTRHWRKIKSDASVLPAYLNYITDHTKKELHQMLDLYSDRFVEGRWAKSFSGIAAATASAFLLTIDPAKCEYAGQLYRFAGLVKGLYRLPLSTAVRIVYEAKDQVGHSSEPTEAHILACAAASGIRAETLRCRAAGPSRWSKRPREGKGWDDLITALRMSPYCRQTKRAALMAGRNLVFHRPHPYDKIFDKRLRYEFTKTDDPIRAKKLARRWLAKLFLYHYLKVARFSRGLLMARPYSPDPADPKGEIPVPNWPFGVQQPLHKPTGGTDG